MCDNILNYDIINSLSCLRLDFFIGNANIILLYMLMRLKRRSSAVGVTLASHFSIKLQLQLSLGCRVESKAGSECSNKILQRYFRSNYYS